MYQPRIDEFESAEALDNSLSEEVFAVRDNLSHLKGDIPPELQDVVQGFEYLLKLAENDLLYSSEENIIPFYTAIIDLADQFMDAHGPLNKIKQYFEEQLEICFHELPPHLKRKHIENLRGKEVAPEVQKIALKFPTKIATVIALAAVLSTEIELPEQEEKLQSSLAPLPNVSQTVETISPEPLIIKGLEVRLPEIVPVPKIRPKPRPENLIRKTPLDHYSSSFISFVDREKVGMDQRFELVLKKPERYEIFIDIQTNHKITNTSERDRVSLIAILESNIDPKAVSHVGAMGIFQDMGHLQGAFGDPQTLNKILKTPGLLPTIGDKDYEEAKAKGPYVLMDFLKKQKSENSQFWQRFLKSQKGIITDPQKSQIIAHYYLESLEKQAGKIADQNASEIDKRNLGIMAYNMGMGNMKRLKRAMELAGVMDFNTESVTKFIERSDLRTTIHEALMKEKDYRARSKKRKTQMLRAIYHKFQEGQGYITRYIALEQNLDQQRHVKNVAKAA